MAAITILNWLKQNSFTTVSQLFQIKTVLETVLRLFRFSSFRRADSFRSTVGSLLTGGVMRIIF